MRGLRGLVGKVADCAFEGPRFNPARGASAPLCFSHCETPALCCSHCKTPALLKFLFPMRFFLIFHDILFPARKTADSNYKKMPIMSKSDVVACELRVFLSFALSEKRPCQTSSSSIGTSHALLVIEVCTSMQAAERMFPMRQSVTAQLFPGRHETGFMGENITC